MEWRKGGAGSPSPLHLPPMNKLTPTQEEYRKVAEYFLWAEARDFTCWFTGEWKRWKRTEYNLPRMVKKKALIAQRYGKKLVYSVPGKKGGASGDVEHGLICTKSLLRIRFARQGEFVSELFLRKIGFKAIPEWGVIYPSGKMLLFEYSTADNFRRRAHMRRKLNKLKKNLPRFASYFQTEPLVLLVIDAPRFGLKELVDHVGDPFYFTDLKTFELVRNEDLMRSPIYIWGEDGKEYPLTNA